MLMKHDFPLQDDLRKSNPRAASVRIETRNASRLHYQRGHDLRTGPIPGYVDPDRIGLNRLLVPYPRVCEVRDICRERREQRDTVRAMSKTTSIAVTGIVTFGSEAAVLFGKLTPSAQNAAFRELADAIAVRLDTTVSGLTVHLDETTIHAHFELIGYTHAGHPLSQTTRPAILSEPQDITAEIMSRHCPGIERGHRYGTRLANGAEFRETLHRTVKRLHHDLPFDLAEAANAVTNVREVKAGLEGEVESLQARIAAARNEIEALEPKVTEAKTTVESAAARVAEMEGLLAKAQVDFTKAKDDAARKAKVAKRIKTYAKRLGDRNLELQNEQTALAEAIAALEAREAAWKVVIDELQAVRERIRRDAEAEALALKAQQNARTAAKKATEDARATEAAARAEAERLKRESKEQAETAAKAAKDAADAVIQQARTSAKAITNEAETNAKATAADAEAKGKDIIFAAERKAETIVADHKRKYNQVFQTLTLIVTEAAAGTLTVDSAGSPVGSRPGMFDAAPPAARALAARLGKVVNAIGRHLKMARQDEQAAAEARRAAEEARDRYLRGLELQQTFRDTAQAQLDLLDRIMDAARDKATGEIRNPGLAKFFTGVRDGVNGLIAPPADDFDAGKTDLSATP